MTWMMCLAFLPIDLYRIVLAMLTLAMVLAFIRLARGPTLPGRVVALDLMATLMSGILGTSAVFLDQPLFVNVAIVISLVTFLGTVAFARYLEKRVERERKTTDV